VLLVVGATAASQDRVVGDYMLETEEHGRADRTAPQVADAAQDHRSFSVPGLHPVQHVRVDVLAVAREQRPASPADRAGDDEADSL